VATLGVVLAARAGMVDLHHWQHVLMHPPIAWTAAAGSNS
jgi:hypothetical protein